jgi:twitching motility protein PilT
VAETLRELMTRCVEKKASDLHLIPGRPPVLRVKGDLVPVSEAALDDAATEKLCRELCNERSGPRCRRSARPTSAWRTRAATASASA